MKSSRSGARPEPSERKPEGAASGARLVRRHLQFGWWTILVFLTMGLALELMHGFKAGLYLNVSNETRRLMWTLAHAHGTLLGLVNIAFAATARALRGWPPPRKRFASAALLGASVLMPSGFFLGGLFVYAGDPGVGIVLVPVGGLLLFAAILLTAFAVKYFSDEEA